MSLTAARAFQRITSVAYGTIALIDLSSNGCIEVVKKTIQKSTCLFFVAVYDGCEFFLLTFSALLLIANAYDRDGACKFRVSFA